MDHRAKTLPIPLLSQVALGKAIRVGVTHPCISLISNPMHSGQLANVVTVKLHPMTHISIVLNYALVKI